MDRRTIKMFAKEKLHNNWEVAILPLFLTTLVTVAVSALTFGFGSIIISGPLTYGMYRIYDAIISDKEPSWKMLFVPFKERFEDSFIIGLVYTFIGAIPVVGIILTVGSLLAMFASFRMMGYGYGGGGAAFGSFFVFLFFAAISVVLIWLYYSYAAAYVILLRESETKGFAALKKSRLMMSGKKMGLFVFDLSFIGWFLLVGITFGLAGLYVSPYYFCSRLVMLDSIYNERSGMDFSVDHTAERLAAIQNKARETEKSFVSNIKGTNQFEQVTDDYPAPDNGFAEEVSAVKYCRNCGAEIPAEAMFCGKCGSRQ